MDGAVRRVLAVVLVGMCLVVCGHLGSCSAEKALTVRMIDRAPRIDGAIEAAWSQADSVTDFVQFTPYEKQPPTEKTVVYALQDGENLYFAFRCWAQKHKPTACLTADEDYIAVAIDPFGSKTTAYFFLVYGSEIMSDGWVLDDGRTRDDSWEGVWFRAAGLYPDRLEVELKIPFKTIRYRGGLNEWGVDFVRYVAANRETDSWTEYTQVEGSRVSRYGMLRGIQPRVTGYNFEIYPEGFLRTDEYAGENAEAKLTGSLNLKWDLTPQTSLNATFYPDFAQIESDPFTLNLSRYPIYLGERRPFFIEGMEIFRLSDFGEDMGFFHPLDIFYSRRVGKSVGQEFVPILAGLKFTGKYPGWNIGALGAFTDDLFRDGSVTEPARSFGAVRVKRQIGTSDMGLLFSGTRVSDQDYNYALGLDGVYRHGPNQFILQPAFSDKNGKKGAAVATGFSTLTNGILTMGGFEAVEDSFDVSDIGFVPWAGRKSASFFAGPQTTYERGFLQELHWAPGIYLVKEPRSPNWSRIGSFLVTTQFRNSWGGHLEGSAGKAYEADTNYISRSATLNIWGNLGGQRFSLGTNYNYGYNYYRGFLAHSAAGWLRIARSLIPELSVVLNGNSWAEWDQSSQLIGVTTVATPRIDCRFNADMTVSVFNEMVLSTPQTDVGATDLLSNRIGVFYSWNFLPKSWVYLALNDYRERDASGDLRLQSRVGAVKAKYLVYF